MKRTKWQKLKYRLLNFVREDLPREAFDLKCRVWNAGVLLAWYRLFLRKDELHISLALDPFAIRVMSEEEEKKYHQDLRRRREIAHGRDLGEC